MSKRTKPPPPLPETAFREEIRRAAKAAGQRYNALIDSLSESPQGLGKIAGNVCDPSKPEAERLDGLTTIYGVVKIKNGDISSIEGNLRSLLDGAPSAIMDFAAEILAYHHLGKAEYDGLHELASADRGATREAAFRAIEISVHERGYDPNLRRVLAVGLNDSLENVRESALSAISEGACSGDDLAGSLLLSARRERKTDLDS